MMRLSISRDGWIALGKLLKESRDQMKWSIDDLATRAKELGGGDVSIAPSTISAIERGNSDPKLSTLLVLSGLGYIKNPETKEPMDLQDLCDYAIKQGLRGQPSGRPLAAETKGVYQIPQTA